MAHLLSPLLALALVPGVGTLDTECLVCVDFSFLVCDFAGFFVDVGIGKGDLCAGCGCLEVLLL